MSIEKRSVSLKEFIEGGEHQGFGKSRIEEMARKQLEENKDYVHNVRNTQYVISVGSIRAYFATPPPPPEVVEPPSVVEPPKATPVQRKPATPKKR